MAGRASLLPWIVAFKALKALLLTTLGVTVLVAVHRDPVDLVMQVAQAVHLPLTSRVIEHALTLAFNTTPRKEIAAAVAAFGYAVLMGTEGVGLYLRRPWARWFTVIATGSLVPVELYELARDVTATRIAILILNLAVLVYLVRRPELFESDTEA